MQRLDKIRPHQAREGEVTASGALVFRCIHLSKDVCTVCTNIICELFTRFTVSCRKPTFISTALVGATFARGGFGTKLVESNAVS